MEKIKLELYTDYLMCNSGFAMATGLSAMARRSLNLLIIQLRVARKALEHKGFSNFINRLSERLAAMVERDISHDQMTCFLSSKAFTSKDLWGQFKATVHQIEQEDGCLIFDDTIQEKVWTDENEIMCWHYDHCKERSVKGINLLNALYYSDDVSIPVAFEVVRKPHQFSDVKTHNVKRASEITKNELMRRIIATSVANAIKFRYVLTDSWFASKENFEFILKKSKHFISALKDNRLVALTEEDKKEGRFVRISQLELADQQAVRGWLKGFPHEVLFVRRVFTNKDSSIGLLNLVCSDFWRATANKSPRSTKNGGKSRSSTSR